MKVSPHCWKYEDEQGACLICFPCVILCESQNFLWGSKLDNCLKSHAYWQPISLVKESFELHRELWELWDSLENACLFPYENLVIISFQRWDLLPISFRWETWQVLSNNENLQQWKWLLLTHYSVFFLQFSQSAWHEVQSQEFKFKFRDAAHRTKNQANPFQ